MYIYLGRESVLECTNCNTDAACYALYSVSPTCLKCSSISSRCTSCGSRTEFLWNVECNTCEADPSIQLLSTDYGKICADDPINPSVSNCAILGSPPICGECMFGYALNSQLKCTTCQAYSDGCRKCSLGTNPTCNDCKSGYGLQYDEVTSGLKCASCESVSADCKLCREDGESTPREFKCLETSSCTSHCMSCTASECTSWHDGYFPATQNPLNVLPCVENCQKCNNGASCVECKSGYRVSIDSSSCISCSSADPECSQCTYEGGNLVCKSCWGEMTLNANVKYPEEGDMCSKSSCDEYIGCSLCSYTQCLQCESHLYLDSSGAIATCKFCESKYTDCLSCDPNECTQCITGSAEYFISGVRNCMVCGNIYMCDGCEYLGTGHLNCTTCAQGYGSETAYDSYDYCKKSGITLTGCVEQAESDPNYCDLCAFGFLDQYYSGECLSCPSKISYCVKCSLLEVVGIPSVVYCDKCQAGFTPNTDKLYCIEDNCVKENCQVCEGSGCKYCLPGYMKDSNSECASCEAITFSGCMECKVSGGGHICTSCLPGYGEQQMSVPPAPPTEEVRCISCDSLSKGCDQCMLNPSGEILRCDTCSSGYSVNQKDVTKCLDCSVLQDECKMCGLLQSATTPETCEMCIDSHDLIEIGEISYCREKGCNVNNCIGCDQNHCTKCFGTATLTPDKTLCYDGGKCSLFSLRKDKDALWTLDECFECPSGEAYNDIDQLCYPCNIEHCVSSACTLITQKYYCGLCEQNYIPQISLNELKDVPNYPYYLGTTCVQVTDCTYFYSTQFTDLCLDGTRYILYIYIYIYIYIGNQCPDGFTTEAVDTKFKCVRKSRKAIIYVSNNYLMMSDMRYFNPVDSDTWVGTLNKPIYNLFLAYWKVYILYIYIYIGSDTGIP